VRPTIRPFLQLLNDLEAPGDFMELGVYQGDSFVELLEVARKRPDKGRVCHAVDSFRGMAQPGKEDGGQGSGYPLGRFDQGGSQRFRHRLDGMGYRESEYFIHEGYVPAILNNIESELVLGAALIDLDHYEPTAHALKWVWARLQIGGLLICDDYFPKLGNIKGYAHKAVHEFVMLYRDRLDLMMSGNDGRTHAFRKLEEPQ